MRDNSKRGVRFYTWQHLSKQLSRTPWGRRYLLWMLRRRLPTLMQTPEGQDALSEILRYYRREIVVEVDWAESGECCVRVWGRGVRVAFAARCAGLSDAGREFEEDLLREELGRPFQAVFADPQALAAESWFSAQTLVEKADAANEREFHKILGGLLRQLRKKKQGTSR